eukprot:8867714-Prorocentrum_lima.AAC.1
MIYHAVSPSVGLVVVGGRAGAQSGGYHAAFARALCQPGRRFPDARAHCAFHDGFGGGVRPVG